MTSRSDIRTLPTGNSAENAHPGLVRRIHTYIGIYWLTTIVLIAGLTVSHAEAAPVIAPVSGEIQYISINDMGDHWSGGTINVGGTVVIIPRNLLIDLPANRLTLQEIYAQAPADCVAAGETGLAKGDSCNHTGMGGIAAISGNKTNGGNVIAGDMLIEKAAESVTGAVTYINYDDGYFRINGMPGDSTTGVMVRLNDPDGVHTVQMGLGCGDGPNCSADPRFTLDGSNYNNTFTTGYPLCIPSTFARSFTDVLRLVDPAGVASISTQSDANGVGDMLCPDFNRPAGGLSGTATDSRRFAPILLGDHVVAEGNFETINGTRFLSAHTTQVSVALTTNTALANQPDYMIFAEVFMEAPGFQNQRMRNMYIGFTSVSPADVLIWSLHYDPVTNNVHEFPLASTAGCDIAAGAQSCTGQGVAVSGWDIFRIRYDVDFGIGARADLNPCEQVRAEPRFSVPGVAPICPNGPILDARGRFDTDTVEMMGIMQPVAHEVQARTGRKLASLQPGGIALITLDIKGMEATNGQYLIPLGMNLGGIEVAEMTEIDLAKFATPLNFTGIPWNMDRRLSPGGCIDLTGDGIPDCEATAQPLDPFPFEGLAMDPRLQAPPIAGLSTGLPSGPYNDPNYTSTTLSSIRDRIFSFVSAAGNFNGNATVFPIAFNWSGLAPLLDPAAVPIGITPELTLMCFDSQFINYPPVAVDDFADAVAGAPVIIDVLANDSDPNVDPLAITSVSVNPAFGVATTDGLTVTYTPALGTSGIQTFNYVVADGQLYVTGNVTITIPEAVAPAAPTSLSATPDASGTSVALAWIDNANNETAYRVEVSTDGSNYALLTTLPRSAADAIATNVAVNYAASGTPGAINTYRVTAINVTGVVTLASTPASVDANLSAPATPTAPTGLIANVVNPTTALLSWSENATTETGYSVEVETNGVGGYFVLASLPANTGSYAAPVSVGNSYNFRVRAQTTNLGSTSYSAYSGPVAVDMTVPATPTALVATPAVNGATVALSWTDAASNETDYLVEVSTDGGATYGVVATLPAGSVGHTATTTPGTSYMYRVTARNVVYAVTIPSASATVAADLSAPAAPAAPTVLTTSVLSTASLQLGWTDNATTETGYSVEVSTNGGAYVALPELAANSTGYTATIAVGNTYSFQVRALTSNLGSTTPSTYLGPVAVDMNLPAAPTGVGATLNTATTALVFWTDNATTETGYLVEVSADGGATFGAPSLNRPANSTGATPPVTLGNSYVFRVSATKTVYGLTLSSSSITSGIVVATAPAAPSNLTATPAPGFTQANLVWKDNSNNEASFLIEVTTDGTNYSTLTTVTRNSVQARAVGDLLYYTAATPLSANYTYRVSAVNVIGVSAPTTSASVDLTPQVAPAAPSSVAAVLNTGTTSLVFWTDNTNDENGYLLEQSIDGGATWSTVVNLVRNAAQTSSTGGSVGYYSAIALGKSYIYRVSAYKTVYGVNYTSSAVTTGIVYATIPAGPTNLNSAILAGGTQVNLSWTDSANNEASYLVEVSTDGGATYNTLTAVSRNSVEALQTGQVLSFLHTSTTPGTTYTYRVRAFNVMSLSSEGLLTVTP